MTLLDPSFLRELEALRRRLEIRARSGAAGERTSSRRGSSAEFQDHRPYAPGDDLRRIDWAAYARTGEPVLKLFRAEEDLVARLLVDASASMAMGTPPKIEIARRISAALGYLALSGSERAQLFAARERVRMETPVRGRGGVAPLLRSLGVTEAEGKGDLSGAIDTVIRRSPRPGMLAVVSDFFDGGPVLTALSRARAAGHDVVLCQVVAKEEEEPDLEGDLALVDAETGETVEVTADAAALEAYAMRFAGLCEELRGFARKHGATYVRVRTVDSLVDAVRRVVERSVD
jgi:uncharacterized protein (DUF58 family)